MVNWVEKGNAPEILKATVGDNGQDIDLCPYPKKLADDGQGYLSCEMQSFIDVETVGLPQQ